MRNLALIAVFVLALSAAPDNALSTALPKMTVYKTATCGCCAKWIDHMKAAGFNVKVEVVANTAPYRQQFGMPDKFGSCHTAVAGGYTFEGHIPPADIKKFLKAKPDALGLAVPGMPLGSPGMESVRSDPYNTLQISKTGASTVFEKH
jgi:hypothetical protein